ncbi:MAG: hypothetical protein ACPG7E_06650, partial [Marinirhabdus sp.]
KLWPLSSEMVLRDRPYYAMVRYQNYIDREQGKTLSQLSFRDYWKEAYEKKSSRDTTGYFPSLIMNTAATNGSRGILWSVAQKDFTNIFPFSQNLADLPNDRTLPFYQAVSTTNRFPFLSPAAKIPGHGHYIDAGAIDNSGLLSLLDLHNHLRRCDTTILANKQVAYIEIVNGKSPYTEFVLTNFKKEMGNPHIFIDEFETDNIIADLKTGFNLDKIPNYLSNFLSLWQKTEKGKIRYFRIFMPHKITVKDVESYLNGEIMDPRTKKQLSHYLATENNKILALTDSGDNPFVKPWKYYEPTLSRHLGKSSLNYMTKILEHPLLKKQFAEITKIINSQKIKTNENLEISL